MKPLFVKFQFELIKPRIDHNILKYYIVFNGGISFDNLFDKNGFSVQPILTFMNGTFMRSRLGYGSKI